MRIKNSISYKVVVILVPGIIMVMTIWGVFQFFSQREQAMNAIRTRAHQTAERISNALATPVWNVDHSQVENIVLLEMANQEIQAILVYEYMESSEKTKFSIGKIKDAQWEITDYFPGTDTEYNLQTSFLYLRRDIIKPKNVNNAETLIGFVEIVATDHFVKKALEDLVIKSVLQTVMVSVAIILFGVFSLKYVIFDPLLVLRNAVERFRTGDLASRVPIPSQNEIGILMRAFNTMAKQLQESFERLLTVNEQLQQAKEAALEAQHMAEAANRAKSQFLAGISHELRTPLTAILGFAQIMSRSQDFPPEHQESLSTIIRSGEHLLILVNRLIEVSKDKSDYIALDSQSLDLPRLLDDVKILESQQAARHSIRSQPNQPEANQNVLTPAVLAALPEELRTELQQAVEVVDLDAALNLIDQIHQQNKPLAEGLAELVKNYRFDILQELFEKISS